jgi:hypothetical protein
MDWKQLIADLRAKGLTLRQIGETAGMSTSGVHDLANGRSKSVMYETGLRLVQLHRRAKRRKAKHDA